MNPGSQRTTLLLTLLAIGSLAMAQRNTAATGSDASGSGGSMSYTVGQVDFTMQSGPDGTVSQGVQQPYEFLVLAQSEPQGTPFESTLYPNPATGDVQLRITGGPSLPLRVELRDEQGKLLHEARFAGASAVVPLAGRTAGIYLVHVLEENNHVKTFQVIKH